MTTEEIEKLHELLEKAHKVLPGDYIQTFKTGSKIGLYGVKIAPRDTEKDICYSYNPITGKVTTYLPE